jgi:uncharacterized repeat protein (TIGR03803 family)
MATPTHRHPILYAAILLAASATPTRADYPLTVLASFDGTNGSGPQAGVTLVGNTLYGTTYNGGAYNRGAVFSVPTYGGTPTVLGSLNGTNGSNPQGSLLASGGMLYGTANRGGLSFSIGTVFSLPMTGGTPTVLDAFGGVLQGGAYPQGKLTLSGNKLYGTTMQGGPKSAGTVYSIPVAGGAETVLAAFDGSSGGMWNNSCPYGGVTFSLDGQMVYGTTSQGGPSNCGIVYSLPITGGTPTVLASFNGTNGEHPLAGLTLSPDGNTLYGTTSVSGAYGYGTVFSVPTTGGAVTTLASLNAPDGSQAFGGLALSGDGSTLYGTARYGGASNMGTVFSVPVAGGTPTILASFDGSNGEYPQGDLLLSGTTLYGTTYWGGPNGHGTVFSITVPEPASLLLLSLAAPALLLRRKPRKG